MSEDSDHLPELLVSQDIRSCIETVRPMVPIRRGLHHKDVARGIGEMYGCCNPWIAQAKRTRPRSPESLGRLRLFNIKIAPANRRPEGLGHRHSGHPAIAARSAGRRRERGRGGRHRRDTGTRRRAKRNGTVKASVTGSASASGSNNRKKQLQRPRG
jgi:hypothetical protein